jgi:hypothetical protein
LSEQLAGILGVVQLMINFPISRYLVLENIPIIAIPLELYENSYNSEYFQSALSVDRNYSGTDQPCIQPDQELKE